jgi:hypothetical protein
VILELKSVEQIGKVHAKQVFTYLKLKGLKLGFVLNFGTNLMKDDIDRVVNGLPEENPGVLPSAGDRNQFRARRSSEGGSVASVSFAFFAQAHTSTSANAPGASRFQSRASGGASLSVNVARRVYRGGVIPAFQASLGPSSARGSASSFAGCKGR